MTVVFCHGSTVDLNEYEDGEERTIFTSGGTYYIALNTTYLLLWSALLGALLLGALLLSSGTGASTTGGYGSGYSGYQQKSSEYEGYNRQKRQADWGKISLKCDQTGFKKKIKPSSKCICL